MTTHLTFQTLREQATLRNLRTRAAFIQTATGWANRLAGATSAIGFIVDELRQHQAGTSYDDTDPAALRSSLGKHLARAILAIDQVAAAHELDLAYEVALQFNRASIRDGQPQRLPMLGMYRAGLVDTRKERTT